uniref:Uncharacterized protein n=1 Tax=Globodera rostochiensis TaxID=31243 RepID=A0A914GXL8_GLORO
MCLLTPRGCHHIVLERNRGHLPQQNDCSRPRFPTCQPQLKDTSQLKGEQSARMVEEYPQQQQQNIDSLTETRKGNFN